MVNKGEINNMDQEYKADICFPRNTSAAEVEKLTGDSTVRNVGNDEISPEDSQSNRFTCSSNDNSYNEYQSITRDGMNIAIHVSLKRKSDVVSIENEEKRSKKAKLEESKPEINASDQDVRQGNKKDEISDDNVNGIEESVDQNDDICTLTDTETSEIGKCESENDDVEVNVANQYQSHTASSTQDETDEQGPSVSTSTATVIKRPEAEILPKLYRLLRENDRIENGLVAKDPNGHLSVAEHVANGSGGGQSWYISTCSSLYAALHFLSLKTRGRCRYRNGRKEIAEIDVAKLQMEVEIIDLRTEIDRERYELQNRMDINRKFHKFAESHSEVLLVGKVPPECLTLT